MLALAYSYLLFAYWVVVGRAIIAVAYPRAGVLRSWLLAPAIGLSVVLLGLMALNQAGIPIGVFGRPMTGVIGVAAVVVLLWRRPTLPGRVLAPFIAATIVSLLWTGWPAFETGFNWVSYANDDMANYCLAAQRFIDHGFFAVPTMAELGGRDYSSYYYFMHVADMMRFGAEHLVAWSTVVAGVQATQGFMPAILALGLVQLTALGALVLRIGRLRRHALVAIWILAASPLFMLGSLYQLIAQVGGIALLLTIVALLTRPWITPHRRTAIRFAILPALAAAALCIFYPEVSPFTGLAFLGFAAVWTARNRRFPAALLGVAAYTLVGALLLLRYNVISYVSILVVQFNGAMDASNLLLSLFPYFMLPTGFPDFLGWMPIAHDFPEPILSASIALGMLLVLLVLIRAVRDAWRLSPPALLLLIQFVFAVRLFKGANDFGLYKLAMWMQPVLAAGLAAWIVAATPRRRTLAYAVVALFALSTAATGYYYTNAARGVDAGSLTELRMASRLGLNVQVPNEKDPQFTSTIENVVAAKFAASHLRGNQLALVSRDFFWPTTRTDYHDPIWPVAIHPHFKEMAAAVPLIAERNDTLIKSGMLWHTQFTQPVLPAPTTDYVSLDPQLSLFNKYHLSDAARATDSVFVVEPQASVHNRLLFVHSGLGNHYYLGDRRRISFFQQEPDLFAPGYDFNGIGRFMLLRIENPSPKIYLRISATRTLVTGRTAWNARAVVHGATDLPLGAIGNGAFNLFIGPLAPQAFEGAHYVAIDFAEFPKQLNDARSGLKRLYNRAVPLDYRRVLGWARDISAITEDEYARLHRPRAVSNFPADLALAQDLEYAGAYEDGWLSHDSKFVLAGAKPGDLLRLRLMVPQLPGGKLGTGRVAITIDGKPVAELPASLGTHDWLIPVPQGDATTTVGLTFSATDLLPKSDQRPVAARLAYLGLVEQPANFSATFPAAGGPQLPSPGVDADGWLLHRAIVLLPASNRAATAVLHLEYPDWGGARPATLTASLDGTVGAKTIPLTPGTAPTVELSLPADSRPHELTVDATSELTLPAPDGRRRSVRITKIELRPVAP